MTDQQRNAINELIFAACQALGYIKTCGGEHGETAKALTSAIEQASLITKSSGTVTVL